jgi:Dolichyl-phosphate-mannose-protein mannosyltransferase
LSTFTHLWNAVGFPDQAPDDGTYIRRALRVIEGLGPQQDTFYDHPYFGQIFLGTVFIVIGYPDITVPSMPASMQDLQRSVEMLYTIPRILMAILAVVDTFLIYKIAEWRYNRNVAFIAAILFAITPLSWLFRRMYLDPIQLPFLLTAILFALYSGLNARQKSKLKEIKKVKSREENGEIKVRERERESQGKDSNNYHNYKKASNRNIILLLSSGIFMGLTIFTKIPAVTLIPLVGFIVFTNNKKSFKALGIWIIPVILIPLIWPAYALFAGHLESWLDDVVWQATERPESSLWNSLRDLIRIDPVLILLGSIGFVYAALKKDPLILLWLIPFIVFFYFVGRITYNYWVPLLPAFCITGAVFITDLSDKVMSRISKSIGRFLPFVVVSSIAIFGLIINVMLITINLTSTQIQAAAFAQYELNKDSSSAGNSASSTSNVSVISGPNYSWIFKYVFKEENVLDNFRDRSPIDTEKFIMITDMPYKTFLRRDDSDRSERLETLYDNTLSLAKFNWNTSSFDYDKYPYFSVRQGRAGSEVDVRSNY